MKKQQASCITAFLGICAVSSKGRSNTLQNQNSTQTPQPLATQENTTPGINDKRVGSVALDPDKNSSSLIKSDSKVLQKRTIDPKIGILKNQQDETPPAGKPEIEKQESNPDKIQFDLRPQINRNFKIYFIQGKTACQAPYSRDNEWQQALNLYQQRLNLSSSQQPGPGSISSVGALGGQQNKKKKQSDITQHLERVQIHREIELMVQILCLRNRNWIQEQVKMSRRMANMIPASFDSLVVIREALQLREHFNWLVWALGYFYFQMTKIDQFFQYCQSQNIKDQNQFQNSQKGTSQVGGVKQKHQNVMFHEVNHLLSQVNTLKSRLPSQISRKWTEGFQYQGVYLRMLPRTDSQFVKNELKSLKYIQNELMELYQLQSQLINQVESTGIILGKSPKKQGMPSSVLLESKSIYKKLILPLLSTVECGGFLVYASPVIYIPGYEEILSPEDDPYEIQDDNLLSSKIMLTDEGQIRASSLEFTKQNGKSEIVFFNKLIQNKRHQRTQSMNLTKLYGSEIYKGQNIAFEYQQNKQKQTQKKDQEIQKEGFELIQENLNEIDDQLLKIMPLLQYLTKQNLIPIMDFDDYTQTELNYFVIHTYNCLPAVSSVIFNSKDTIPLDTIALWLPQENNEETKLLSGFNTSAVTIPILKQALLTGLSANKIIFEKPKKNGLDLKKNGMPVIQITNEEITEEEFDQDIEAEVVKGYVNKKAIIEEILSIKSGSSMSIRNEQIKIQNLNGRGINKKVLQEENLKLNNQTSQNKLQELNLSQLDVRVLTKHGFDIIIISGIALPANTAYRTDQSQEKQKPSIHHPSQLLLNKRATTLFMAREEESNFEGLTKVHDPVSGLNLLQTYISFLEVGNIQQLKQSKSEITIFNAFGGGMGEYGPKSNRTNGQKQINLNLKKQTILRRLPGQPAFASVEGSGSIKTQQNISASEIEGNNNDNNTEQGMKVQGYSQLDQMSQIRGNALFICRNTIKDFKLKYALINHGLTDDGSGKTPPLEAIFMQSISKVARILEDTDTITSVTALKELLHRKGLNLRFEWLLLVKLRNGFSRELVMIHLLVRIMKKIICEEVKIKSQVFTPQKQKTNIMMNAPKSLAEHQKASGVAKNNQQTPQNLGPTRNTLGLIREVTGGLRTLQETQQQNYDHFCGSDQVNFKDNLVFFSNTLLRRKFSKQKHVFDESLIGLFIARLKIMPLINSILQTTKLFVDLEKGQQNGQANIAQEILPEPSRISENEQAYLESKQILEDILAAPSQNPALFMATIQCYFHVDIEAELLRKCRQDKFLFLSKLVSQPIAINHIQNVNLICSSYYSVKEYAYFMFANMMHKAQADQEKELFQKFNQIDKGISQSEFQGGITGDLMNDSFIAANQKLRNQIFKSKNLQKSQRGQDPFENSQQLNSSFNQSNKPKNKNQNGQGQSTNPIIFEYLKNGGTGSEATPCFLNSSVHSQASALQSNQVQKKQLEKSVSANILQRQTPLIAAQNQMNRISDLNMETDKDNQVKQTTYDPDYFYPKPEIIIPSILYKLNLKRKTNQNQSTPSEMDLTSSLLPYYVMPGQNVFDSWIMYLESILKELYTIDGAEQIYLEALNHQALTIYLGDGQLNFQGRYSQSNHRNSVSGHMSMSARTNNGYDYRGKLSVINEDNNQTNQVQQSNQHQVNYDKDQLNKVIQKIKEISGMTTRCSPEVLIMSQVLCGLNYENIQDDSIFPIEAEKYYLSALLCLFQVYGDPRGRGNFSHPIMILISWKLSLLALSLENRKIHDAEFSEELFDATLYNLINHKSNFRKYQNEKLNRIIFQQDQIDRKNLNSLNNLEKDLLISNQQSNTQRKREDSGKAANSSYVSNTRRSQHGGASGTAGIAGDIRDQMYKLGKYEMQIDLEHKFRTSVSLQAHKGNDYFSRFKTQNKYIDNGSTSRNDTQNSPKNILKSSVNNNSYYFGGVGQTAPISLLQNSNILGNELSPFNKNYFPRPVQENSERGPRPRDSLAAIHEIPSNFGISQSYSGVGFAQILQKGSQPRLGNNNDAQFNNQLLVTKNKDLAKQYNTGLKYQSFGIQMTDQMAQGNLNLQTLMTAQSARNHRLETGPKEDGISATQDASYQKGIYRDPGKSIPGSKRNINGAEIHTSLLEANISDIDFDLVEETEKDIAGLGIGSMQSRIHQSQVLLGAGHYHKNLDKGNKQQLDYSTTLLDVNQEVGGSPFLNQNQSQRENFPLDEHLKHALKANFNTDFTDANFSEDSLSFPETPFVHWSIYRQGIQNIVSQKGHIFQRNQKQLNKFLCQMFKNILFTAVDRKILEPWLIKYSVLMNQSGLNWRNHQIKQAVFFQTAQMISSRSSSKSFGKNNDSEYSLNVSVQNSAFSQNQQIQSFRSGSKATQKLGSYASIINIENGSINKADMHGVLYSWGSDGQGQLGHDSYAHLTQKPVSQKILYPRMISVLKDEFIKEVCCGYAHTLAITINGNVYSWGNNQQGQLGLGPDAPFDVRKPKLIQNLRQIVKLQCGNEHSVALNKNYEIFTWGSMYQTGQNDEKNRCIPQKMSFFQTTKVTQIACGGLHTLALTKDQRLYCWGSSEGGQLGIAQDKLILLCQNEENAVKSPQLIESLKGFEITQIACGETHSLVLCKNGNIYGWGTSVYGQLGLGFSGDSFEPGTGMQRSKVPEPRIIDALKDEVIKKIYCGATFSLFLTINGELFGCGMNDVGQLGEDIQNEINHDNAKFDQMQTSDVVVPTLVTCLQGIQIQAVACGEAHVLAIDGDRANQNQSNMLWAWGQFKNGQLGLGELTTKLNPRPVQSLASCDIHKIACGSAHSLALIGDPSNITTLSANFYAGNEMLSNSWAIKSSQIKMI